MLMRSVNASTRASRALPTAPYAVGLLRTRVPLFSFRKLVISSCVCSGSSQLVPCLRVVHSPSKQQVCSFPLSYGTLWELLRYSWRYQVSNPEFGSH